MASAEAAVNTNLALQTDTDIEQSQVEAFREAFSAELGSFMVASETDGPQARVAHAVENIVEGVHAVGERVQAFGEAVTPRKAVAVLATSAVAVLAGPSALVASAGTTKRPTSYRYMPVAGSEAKRITRAYYDRGCVGGMTVSPGSKRQAHRKQGVLNGYFRGEHATAVLKLSRGAKFCGAMAITTGDRIPTTADRGTEQFVPKFIKGKFIDPKLKGNKRSAAEISVFIKPAR